MSMARLSRHLQYEAADFSFFERFGRGLVYEAERATDRVITAYFEAWERFEDDPEWFTLWGSEIKGISEYDLVDMYASWTMGDDLLTRLACMTAEDRRKHENLDRPRCGSLKALEKRFAEISGEIVVWEIEAGKEYIYPSLDGLLRRRLNLWEEALNDAIRLEWNFDVDDYLTSVNEFCFERTLLEYVRIGVNVIRKYERPATAKDFKRLEPLPYYATFCARLDELDERFKMALAGERYVVPWADRTFWWHTSRNAGE